MSVNGNGANNSTACLILTAQKAGEAGGGREGGEDIWEEAVTMGEAVGQQNCRC